MSFERPTPHAQPGRYTEPEIEEVRRAFRLPESADVTAWCDYNRALSVWRHRMAYWLVALLVSPDEYLRHTLARTKSHPGEFRGTYETVRAQLMELARPGQRPLELAHEILGPGNGSIISELVNGSWLPHRPTSPNRRAPRMGPSLEARQEAADEIAGTL